MLDKVKKLFTRWQAKLTLKSGKVIYFHGSNIRTTRNGYGQLTKLAADDCRDFPQYLQLDEIVAIECRRVLK